MKARPRSSRRGFAAALLLIIVAMTMTLTYALLRTDYSHLHVQTNANRMVKARQAALAGLTVALERMHTSTWSGVETTISGAIDSESTYTVMFVAGDSTVDTQSSTYAETPYRVTLLATGTSADPVTPASSSSVSLRSVVRLVRRAIGTEPSNWGTMSNYTFYQNNGSNMLLNPPMQIKGKARLQGSVRFANEIGWSSTIAQAYFTDSKTQFTSGYSADYRILTGPIECSSSSFTGFDLTYVTAMGPTRTTVSSIGKVTLPIPNSLSSYRLYPGGKIYTVGTVPSTTSGLTLAPSTETNPLGLYFNSGNVTLGNSTNITGTLICKGNVTISGSSSNLLPLDLPSIDGAAGALRMPTLIAGGDISISSASNFAIQGIVVTNGKVYMPTSLSVSKTLTITGKLIADTIESKARSEWPTSGSSWTTMFTLFTSQKTIPPPTGYPYLPAYAHVFSGAKQVPAFSVVTENTTATPHWQDISQPLFQAASGDLGLRWDVVTWAVPQ